MKRVINTSKAWTAAVFMGFVLTGCGGDSNVSAGSIDGNGDTTSSYDSTTKTSGERASSNSDNDSAFANDSSSTGSSYEGSVTGDGSVGDTTSSDGSNTGLSSGDEVVVEEDPVVDETTQEPVTGTAKLSWVAPATREDGEGLTMGELDSYVISYGQDASDLSNTIEINDASTMEYTIDGLGAGEWFFSIQVIDTNGLASTPSELVSKTI